MAKRKHYTGDLFAPDGGFVPDVPEERQDAAAVTVKPAHNAPSIPIKPTPVRRPYQLKKHETKSKRLNLLIRPGVLKEFAKIAYMQQTSVNELINRLISEHNQKEVATIRQYDRLFRNRS